MKQATKEMAVRAKEILEQTVLTPSPIWLKSVELEYDDHGWFITTKIKDRQSYNQAGTKIPATIEINGFKLKNCIMILG